MGMGKYEIMKLGRSIRTPAFSIAVGLFIVTAMGLCAHLVAYWFIFSGRSWPRTFRTQIVMVLGALLLAALLLLVAGLSRLLRKTFRIWRAGAIMWSLATVATGFWPLAALLPATLRLGNLRAARFAALSGCVFLLPGVLLLCPIIWLLPVFCATATVLTLAALCALDDGARPHRVLACGFALVILVSLATQPVFHAGRVSREADAAFSELLETIAAPVDPRTLYPGPPPVPEAEDPVAALDAEALEQENASLQELKKMLEPCDDNFRRHPPTEEELAAVVAWFASHTNLTTAADAMSASPGYRSCLPGPASFAEACEQTPPYRDPRAKEAYRAVPVLIFRARQALAAGNGQAGADTFRRLENLMSIFDGEPTLIAFLMSDAIRRMMPYLIEERIDLWTEDDLLAVQHVAEGASEWAENRLRTALASEFLWHDELLRKHGYNTLLQIHPEQSAFLFDNIAFDYWIAAERRALNRHGLVTWKETNRILGLGPNAFVGEEIERFREEDGRRGTALPPLAAALSVSLPFVLEKVVFLRDKASFVRAAVAVERFRRAKGALPPSLDALVPEFLSDIPRNARTGEPLLYEPGPIEIPEETFPLLRDPDEAAEESATKFKNRLGDVKTVSMQQIVDAVNEECRVPAPGTRTLPAMTLPGFRLTLPDRLGREDRAETWDFFLAAPGATP